MDYINTSHPNFIGGSKAIEAAVQQTRSSRIALPVSRVKVYILWPLIQLYALFFMLDMNANLCSPIICFKILLFSNRMHWNLIRDQPLREVGSLDLFSQDMQME